MTTAPAAVLGGRGMPTQASALPACWRWPVRDVVVLDDSLAIADVLVDGCAVT